METWLKDNIPDAAIQLAGLTTHHANMTAALSGKTCSGGLCYYTSNEWCRDAVVVLSYCSSLVAFMIVQPYYLPREFTTVLIVAVYILPDANAWEAISERYWAISNRKHTPTDFSLSPVTLITQT